MSNTKHSPAPWHYEARGGYIDSETDRIAMLFPGSPTRANAAFIVRAVNSHEQLVDVVKEMMALGERLVDDVYGYEFVQKAKAALAAAEAA